MSDVKHSKLWFLPYNGIEKYMIHPTETNIGRLQFNENLWGPSQKCLEVLSDITAEDLSYYDLKEKDFLKESLAKFIGIDSSHVFLNYGSSEVLKAIFDIAVQRGEYVLIPEPGWGCYKGMIEAKLGKVAYYRVYPGDVEYVHDLDDIVEKAKEYKAKIIILTSPHMPTGTRVTEEIVTTVADTFKDSIVIVDECYYGCADMNLDVPRLIHEYDNLIFVRTMSKIYGLANLRIGYGVCNSELVDLIDYVLPLHKLPNIIRKIADAALNDIEYTEKNKKQIIDAREWLTAELNKRKGVKAFKSYSNFVYIRLDGYDARKIHDYMERNQIAVRLFSDGGSTHMRITVGPREILEKALFLFDEACNEQDR